MAAFKNETNGTWYAMFRFSDWKGERKQKCKRGFATKRDALDWEMEFLKQQRADLDMTFESFVKIYIDDMKTRIREHTWQTKLSIIESKLLPYFKDKKMCDIAPKDIIQWQNEMMRMKNPQGKPYSATYLKTLHNQISAILNHAVRFYELKSNAAAKAGSVGKKEATEMSFWTKDEYLKFADSMMEKPLSFYAFEVLYWCGVRLGEMLALTAKDFDFNKNTVSITKSYQRLNGKDVITDPKTPKSKRVIQIPEFLSEEMQEYIKLFYGCSDDDRLFPISKSYLHHEMTRGSKEQGIKRIRIHDIRHPYGGRKFSCVSEGETLLI